MSNEKLDKLIEEMKTGALTDDQRTEKHKEFTDEWMELARKSSYSDEADRYLSKAFKFVGIDPFAQLLIEEGDKKKVWVSFSQQKLFDSKDGFLALMKLLPLCLNSISNETQIIANIIVEISTALSERRSKKTIDDKMIQEFILVLSKETDLPNLSILNMAEETRTVFQKEFRKALKRINDNKNLEKDINPEMIIRILKWVGENVPAVIDVSKEKEKATYSRVSKTKSGTNEKSEKSGTWQDGLQIIRDEIIRKEKEIKRLQLENLNWKNDYESAQRAVDRLRDEQEQEKRQTRRLREENAEFQREIAAYKESQKQDGEMIHELKRMNDESEIILAEVRQNAKKQHDEECVRIANSLQVHYDKILVIPQEGPEVNNLTDLLVRTLRTVFKTLENFNIYVMKD